MFDDQGFPLSLWVEACNTTIYLQNRSPHKILGMITSEEAFSRRKPNVSHFRIFGSIVYCLVSKYSGRYLEPTIERGIFIGYIETPHIYRVNMPSFKKTMMRGEVIFYEEKSMGSSLK